MSTSFCNNNLTTTALGDGFETPELEHHVFNSLRVARYRDTWHIELEGGEAWVFNYGAVIFWGVSENERQSFLARLSSHVIRPHDKSEAEHYHFGFNATQDTIHLDTFSLKQEDPLHRLAVSHALAQSVKLNVFEATAQQTIADTARIPYNLSQTGRFPLSRRQTAQMRGKLFSTKSDIILHYGLLDTPDFFWDYPELEPLYQLTARYLEITPRVELLSKKLETIHDLFEMLADEQKHRHSATLEWIIIILIALEIVLFAAHEVFFN